MEYSFDKVEITITEYLVKQYAAISGDLNPIHLQKSAANQAGFPHQVAHGMLTMAIGAKVFSSLLQDGWSLSYYKMKFSAPVFVEDILNIESEVVTSYDKKIVLKLRGENQNGDKVASGQAELEKG